MDYRKTSFSDVCGTVDEVKRLLHEERGRAGFDPSVLAPLLFDAQFMLDRMNRRIGEYRAFHGELREILARLEPGGEIDLREAEAAAAAFRERLESNESFEAADTAELSALAERIRAVAGAQERCLRLYKELALKVYDAFLRVKGERPWLLAEEGGEELPETLRQRYQAWLPSDPHGAVLVEWLAAARAHVPGERGADGEPFVEFEDGGRIPMSQARWNEAIRNFHPASFTPGRTGRNYRGS